jgi:O-antigen/teichoic acid export membrane protein
VRFYYGDTTQEDKNTIVSTTIIGMALSALPFVLLTALFSKNFSSFLFEGESYDLMMQIGLMTVWFSLLCDICYTYLRIRYMAKLFVITTLVQLFAALSLNILFVVFMRLDILGVLYSTLITQAATAAFLGFRILKETGTRLSFKVFKHMASFGVPLIPFRIGLMVGFVSNRFFLRLLTPGDPAIALAQVGLLSLGHKFAVIINRFVTVPFNSFWGPRRNELLLGGESQSRETVSKICTYSTLITVYLGLMISAGAGPLIEIMADPSYGGSHLVVPYIVLSYIALSLETHFVTGILMAKKTMYATWISLFGIAVVVVWNFAFIPRWGLIGAATSNLAGFVVRLLAVYVVSQRLYKIPYELGRLAVLSLAAAGLYLLSLKVLLPSPYATFFLRELLVSLYPLYLLAVGFFTVEEKRSFKEVGRKALRFAASAETD